MIPFISNLLGFPVTRKEVLKRAKKFKGRSLCFSISHTLNEYDILHSFNHLYALFPKFIKRNALPFGANRFSEWWWDEFVWETGRMDFLDWLIEEYKDDKTDLRKL